jgi:Fe2+ or Zn2+ uptake regulation protein
MILSAEEIRHRVEEALQAAFQRGWDAAMKVIVEAAASKRPRSTQDLVDALAEESRKKVSMAEVNTRVTAREAVVQALEAKPGMQAAEIHSWTKAKGMGVTFEAIRTAIKRLRQNGTLVRHGDGYAHKRHDYTEHAKARPAPGSWSQHWDFVLIAVTSQGDTFTTDQIMQQYAAIGVPVLRRSVRSKLADLVVAKRLVRISEGRFKVFPVRPNGDELRARGIIPQHARLIGEDAA